MKHQRLTLQEAPPHIQQVVVAHPVVAGAHPFEPDVGAQSVEAQQQPLLQDRPIQRLAPSDTLELVGEPDPETGYVMDLKILSDLVEECILNKFDHKNLNEDTEEFKNLNPTAENIVIVIYNILRPLINSAFGLQVRLYETERNFVEYPA